MKTTLLTGFEPFGGDLGNPSQDIVLALDGRTLAGQRVVGAILPCVFGDLIGALRQLLAAHRPDLVICLGLAADRSWITPERVAINVDDARIPDNAGARPIDRPVISGGPVAYWSRLPIKAIATALTEAGIPAAVSQTAGTFVCNHVFYALMHELQAAPGIRAGFIHVPAPDSTLTLGKLIDGVSLAIETAVQTATDPAVGGAEIP